MPATRSDAAVPLALDILARGERLWVREASLSMLPLIRPGDRLRLEMPDPRRIVPGSVIAYRSDSRLVVHRVVTRDEHGLTAKGDALTDPDPPVPWDRVVARVRALRRADGRSLDFDRFPWPLVDRLLGRIARLSSRLFARGSERSFSRPIAFLLWKALRLPFHLARLVLR